MPKMKNTVTGDVLDCSDKNVEVWLRGNWELVKDKPKPKPKEAKDAK